MNSNNLARDIGNARQRLQELQRQAQTSPEEQTLLQAALEELSGVVAELRVASEDLRAQNIELIESRHLLAAERQHYLELFDFAPDGYIVTDTVGMIREANRAAAKLLGVPRDFLVRKPLVLFFPDQEHKPFRELLTRLQREATVRMWETRIQPRAGAPVPVSLTASITGEIPLMGRPAVGIHWLLRDITERVQSAQVLRESEERFRLLLENVRDAIFMIDPEGFVTSWNAAAERIKGYQAHEILGKHLSCFYPRAEIERGKPQQNLTIAAAEGRFKDEGWRVRKDGSRFWASVVITAVRDDSGKLRGFSKVTRDITERKRAEEQLRESEARLKAITDNCPAMIFLKDSQGRYLYTNPVFEKISRRSGAEVVGKTDFDLFPPEQAAVFRANDLKVLEAGFPLEFEEVAVHDDGLHTSVVCKFPLRDAGGNVYALCGIVTDVTERKRAEAALQQNARLIERLFEYAPDAIVVIDHDGTLAHLNAQVESIFGYRRDELLGKPVEVLLPERFREQHVRHRGTYIAQPRMRSIGAGLDLWGQRKDGSEFPLDIMLSPMESDGRGMVIAIVRDITERKKAEQRLRLQYTTAHALAESATLSEAGSRILQAACETARWDWGELWMVDPDAKVLRSVETYHVPSVEFIEFKAQAREITFSAGVGLVGRVWASGEPVWVANVNEFDESQFLRLSAAKKDGLRTAFAFPVMTGNEILGVMAFFSRESRESDHELLQVFTVLGSQIGLFIERQRAEEALQQVHDKLERRVQERTEDLSNTNAALQTEISKRERIEAKLRASEQQLRRFSQELEEQLIESDRLISVGELAASVAHEFNNPLQIILGYTQELLNETSPSQPAHESLKIVEKETRRCAELIRNLMDFARPAHGNLRPSDVEPVIRAAVKFTSSYLDKSRIKVVVDLEPDLPPIDADPNQLEQVLLNLFFNAAEAMPKGGCLAIRAMARPVSSGRGRKDRELILAVSDTGVGIEPAALPKIFRSFFTTKQKKGMGLGLSICERIIKIHRGRISVESALGKGTTFYLHFPLAEKGDDGRAS